MITIGDLLVRDDGDLGITITTKKGHKLAFFNDRGAEILHVWLEKRRMARKAMPAE